MDNNVKISQLQQLTQMEAPKSQKATDEEFKFTLIRNIDKSRSEGKTDRTDEGYRGAGREDCQAHGYQGYEEIPHLYQRIYE